MNKLAICFSGQGSQYEGMALDFIENHKPSFDLVTDVSNQLGFNFIDKYKHSDYKKTDEVQLMIVLKSMLGLYALNVQNYHVDGYFGFSLGEFTAYYASGIFNLYDTLKIVKIRGDYMQKASLETKGAMAAIIGLNKTSILDTIKPLQQIGTIVIANENHHKQYVISGKKDLVEKAVNLLKTKGARRSVLLEVSGAFHTRLMNGAAKSFAKETKLFKKNKMHTPMLMNVDGLWLNEKDINIHLEEQMTSPVKFIDMVNTLKKDGFTHVLEIGPKKVLTSFIKKIDKDINVMSFDHYNELENVERWLLANGFKK